jgi:nucleoside-diphosphate-sugar epimerase
MEGVGVRVLVTGHDGYVGCLLVPLLRHAGHDVVGLDTGLYTGCALGSEPERIPVVGRDIRDVEGGELGGIDMVAHLAGISNDPLGDLSPDITYDVNHAGTVHLARAARAAGVTRFVFSSSCSNYGAGGEELLDESAPFNPVTAYGHSKVLAEHDLAELANERFSPVFLRSGTAYGVSPRLRGDLVLNNLTGYAVATGEVLLKSDGSPWRPLVHVEDMARAFVAALEAPRDAVHGEAFNVGSTAENYRVRELGALVERLVPGSRVVFGEGAGPDVRTYRVSCEKLAETLPDARPRHTAPGGIVELRQAFLEHGLTREALEGPRFQRVRRVRELQEEGRLDGGLRWQGLVAAGA